MSIFIKKQILNLKEKTQKFDLKKLNHKQKAALKEIAEIIYIFEDIFYNFSKYKKSEKEEITAYFNCFNDSILRYCSIVNHTCDISQTKEAEDGH